LAQEALPQIASDSPAPASQVMLPAGTVVTVELDNDLSTATNHVGDRFNVTVAENVVDRETVVIPSGTAGYGEVTFSTNKGGFGKQGIIGISLRFLDLNGRQVALDGRYREEGKGNDGAAAATMFAVGIFAVVVKGKSAVIPKGRRLKARTGEDIAFMVGAATPLAVASEPGIPPGASSGQQPAAEEKQSTPN
jgi:hypothetical protein